MKNWTYILTWGKSLELYKQGNKRICIDHNTGRIIYEVKYD